MQKMSKSKIDERAVKIAKNLLAKLKARNIISLHYVDAYHQAICDFIYNYTGEDLRQKELDESMDAMLKMQAVK